SDHAARFIKETEQEKPCFMYVAYTAAHWPMHALEKDIGKYKGKFGKGYQHYRNQRYEKLKKLGLIDPSWKLSPQEGSKWSKVKNKAWEERCMEVYAGMVDNMDQGIGRIVSELKRKGELDNTLILFMQDNGGAAARMGRVKFGGQKQAVKALKPTLAPMKNTDLQADNRPQQSRDGYPMLGGPDVMPGPDGTYIAYGRAWANVSNTPFRLYKMDVHEGGIATPLIAHWPAGFKRKGALVKTPSHLIDIMATCVEISGAEYPAEFNGQKIQQLEGNSLTGLFSGEQMQQRDLFWEHEGNRAIRRGAWKLVSKKNKPWELYNLEKDRTELQNFAEQKKQLVKELSEAWQAYAKRARVLPRKRPRTKK
ncbi:MAG: sulfatase-like hydrolase/transferase, partial [Lentisphaeraceae bacterium]|nr:sulfatase-like hydrolase/transferase [Lentisphaeraceae bacterium]